MYFNWSINFNTYLFIVVSYFKSASSLSLKSTLTEVNLFSHHGKIVNIKDFKDTPTLLFSDLLIVLKFALQLFQIC